MRRANLGFSPHLGARSLRRAKSKDLGVLFSSAHLTELEIVAAIYAAAAKRGLEVILSARTQTRATGLAVQELLGHRCAALILIGSTYDVVRSAGDKGIGDMVAHVLVWATRGSLPRPGVHADGAAASARLHPGDEVARTDGGCDLGAGRLHHQELLRGSRGVGCANPPPEIGAPHCPGLLQRPGGRRISAADGGGNESGCPKTSR
jgi:hypothetical protein